MDKHFHSRVNNFKKIWLDYLKSKNLHQLDIWLANHFRENKKFGSKDRRFYRDSFFKLLRAHGIISYSIDPEEAKTKFSQIETTDHLLDYLKSIDLEAFLAKSDSLDKESVESIVSTLNTNDISQVAIATSTSLDVAEKIRERIKLSFGDNSVAYLTNLVFQPKAWIRIDKPEKTNELISEADSEGLSINQIGDEFYFEQSPKIKNLKSYQKSVFDFQDLASQNLTKGLPDEFGPKFIWDVCAGAGGKTLSMAKAYPKSKIYSSDVRSHKLTELKNKSKKIGYSSIKVFTHDATFELSNNLSSDFKIPKFDLVVIDAPCSSSGTSRRSPDALLRLSPTYISEFTALQAKILDTAKSYLSPEGFLIYSTCSIFKEENENIIEKFLEENSNFRIYGTRMEGSPYSDSDTMFKAILQRI